MSKKKNSKSLPQEQVNTNQIDINEIDSLINDEIKVKLQRPLYKLPTHKDLSRLASNYYVIDHENNIYNFKDLESGKNIKNLVLCLSSIIEKEKTDHIKEKLEEHIHDQSTDLQTEVLSFFQNADDLDNPTLKTLQLLKSCNQSILAPALVNLQLCCSPTYTFIDLDWYIFIRFFKSHIVVEHRRRQTILNHGSFSWKLSILHRKDDISLLDTSISITKINAGNETEKLLKFFKKYYEAPLIESEKVIFSKSWKQLPIAKDISRFSNSCNISFNNINYDVSEDDDQPTRIKKLLLVLSERFNQEINNKINETFENIVQSLIHSDSNATIRSYFSNTLELDDEDPFARILKFFTQSILAPIVTKIQFGLSKIYPIKDGKTWCISVIEDDEHILITHSKEEVSLFNNNPFSFKWEIKFTVDKNVTEIMSIEPKLLEFNGPEEDNEDLESLIHVIINT